jgi:hypothetical protein
MIAQWDLCLCERIGSHAKEWWLGPAVAGRAYARIGGSAPRPAFAGHAFAWLRPRGRPRRWSGQVGAGRGRLSSFRSLGPRVIKQLRPANG